jgi:hypothetical protein
MAELPTQRDFEDFAAWSGRDVLGPDGDRLGAVELIFLDEATGVPEWVLVDLGDGDPAFVPLAGASVEEQAIRVEQDRERVGAAPRPEPAETLSVADERRLYEHYGLAYSQEESSTVLPEGASREERPRLRKYVGAPVAAPAAEPPEPETTMEQPASTPSPSLTTIPGPAPHVIPPEGGFQSREAEDDSRVPSFVKDPKTAIPIGLAALIGVLIGVLFYRNKR